jgi:hypothetical protein
MPITLDQFTKQFEKLQASQGTTKSPRVLDQWFEEFQNCEYFPFVKAMKRLQYGQKFPNWEAFKAEYRNTQGIEANKPEYKGCEHCQKGMVMFRDIHLKSGLVSDQAANCSLCSQGRIRDMANKDPSKLVVDSMGTLRTKRALVMDLENGMRVDPPKQSTSERENIMTIVQGVGVDVGRDDSEKETVRRKSLHVESKRENLKQENCK